MFLENYRRLLPVLPLFVFIFARHPLHCRREHWQTGEYAVRVVQQGKGEQPGYKAPAFVLV
jgi:hypothetical protein